MLFLVRLNFFYGPGIYVFSKYNQKKIRHGSILGHVSGLRVNQLLSYNWPLSFMKA